MSDAHEALVRGLRPALRRGEMRVILPGALTPEDADPFIGARSPDGEFGVVAHTHLAANGSFFITSLEVWSWDGSPVPLGTDVLRRLPLGRWTTLAQAWLARRVEEFEMGGGRANEELRRLARAKVLPSSGSRGFGEDFYRRLALEYLKLQAQGVSRGIRERLAQQEARRQKQQITVNQIRDALVKATALGFLSPGTPGRAGRLPGPNLFTDDEQREATDGN